MAQKKVKVFLTGPHGFASVHNEPSLTLFSFLQSKGWTQALSAEESDAICSIEFPLNRFHSPRIPVQSDLKGLLVVQEPSVVRPFHENKKLIGRFSRVILTGRPNLKSGVFWPALYLERFHVNSQAQKLPIACLIASNKVSLLPGELYSLRRKVVKTCPKIQLFGGQWDSKLAARLKQIAFEIYLCSLARKIPNLRNAPDFLWSKLHSNGVVPDKLEANRNYKVSVVIENSGDYMSEKLLEAIAAASIPVYVGPDVSKFGIPSDLVVEVDANANAVCNGVEIALNMDFEDWVKRCNAWLSDPKVVSDWSLNTYWERIHLNLLQLAGKD